MQAIRTVLPAVALLLAFTSIAWADSLPKAKSPPEDFEKVFADACRADADGKFEEALKGYLRALTAGRTDLDIRDRIRSCYRHVSQAERHQNPAHRRFLASLPASDALTLYEEVIARLHKSYADRGKATVERLFSAGLDEFIAALSERAFRDEHLPGVSDSKVAEFRNQLLDTWQNKLPATPQEVQRAARAVVNAANKTLGLKNGSVVVFELLCGACTGLDEYSAYLPPGHTPDATADDLAAYGLSLLVDGRTVVVGAVAASSWAAVKTKLRKGDRIDRVNGRAVTTPAEVVAALALADTLGHAVEYTSADDDTLRTLQLPVPAPTVFGVDLLEPKEGIGYLRLAAFRDRTPQEFDDAILELKARGMRALVVDVRGNPGGLLASALGIAKRLVPAGPLATTDGQTAEFVGRLFTSDSGMAAYRFPVVLLLDTRTMSAAEILAASLKDSQRATLVGLPTFGKGMLQGGYEMKSLGGGKSGVLILSVASAGGPLSGMIQGRGVTPHIIESSADRQIPLAVEKALELLAGLSNPMPMSGQAVPPALLRR
ncbi:MAG: S41 family peptidase [Fimbriiglobus sp.]|nr:S41 family peptidase [Fimbriiglobus sp.]